MRQLDASIALVFDVINSICHSLFARTRLPPFQHLSFRAGRQPHSIAEHIHNPARGVFCAGRTYRTNIELAQADPGKRVCFRKHGPHCCHKTGLPNIRYIISVAKIGIEKCRPRKHRTHVYHLCGIPKAHARSTEGRRVGEQTGHSGRRTGIPFGHIA